MRQFRRQLTALVPAMVALFALRIAEPHPGVYFHEHAGGNEAHVHGDLVPSAHGWEDAHPHSHTFAHMHDLGAFHVHSHSDLPGHHALFADRHVTESSLADAGRPAQQIQDPRATGSHWALPIEGATAHWHTQSTFDRSLAAGPVAPLVRALVADLPLDIWQSIAAQPVSRPTARGPPIAPVLL